MQEQTLRSNRLCIAAAIVAVVIAIGAIYAYWHQESKAYGGPYVKKNCYLTQYRAGGEDGEKALTSATSTQVTVTSAGTEATTTLSSTLVCDVSAANGWDMNLLAVATTGSSALLYTVEYSNDLTNCAATTTEEECNWFTSRYNSNQTAITGATSTSPHGIVIHQVPLNDPTTTASVTGDRDILRRWMRVTFKSSVAASMKVWAEIVIREPTQAR